MIEKDFSKIPLPYSPARTSNPGVFFPFGEKPKMSKVMVVEQISGQPL